MSWPHRTYCDTLAECREVLKHINHFNLGISVSVLSALLEECQMYGNRMEAGLSYGHDLKMLHEKRAKLRLQVKELKAELHTLKETCERKGIELPEDEESSGSLVSRHMNILDDDD